MFWNTYWIDLEDRSNNKASNKREGKWFQDLSTFDEFVKERKPKIWKHFEQCAHDAIIEDDVKGNIDDDDSSETSGEYVVRFPSSGTQSPTKKARFDRALHSSASASMEVDMKTGESVQVGDEENRGPRPSFNCDPRERHGDDGCRG